MSTDSIENCSPIPFAFFCSLLKEIATIPHEPKATNQNPAGEVFSRWCSNLHQMYSPLPRGTTSIVFKMLFPDEDVGRKYDMQETILSHLLAEHYTIPLKALSTWSSNTGVGCLGGQLHAVLKHSSAMAVISRPRQAPCNSDTSLSLGQVDNLLDELASHSSFSVTSIQEKYLPSARRSRLKIVNELYRCASPSNAAFLTQIILKDLRPLLYPSRSWHYSDALRNTKATSSKILSKEIAMKIWDPSGCMLRAYRVKSNIQEVSDDFERPMHQKQAQGPCIGIPIEVPKSSKGRGCQHALQILSGSRKVWAEVKYDGERAQIHVEINKNGVCPIRIFSKNMRDSTEERYAVHYIIRRALSLGAHADGKASTTKVKYNVILDAELVACHGTEIDEFWKIRPLIERTARYPRSGNQDRISTVEDPNLQNSPAAHPIASLHLALVFFDVLLLDSVSLLSRPYSYRRATLESLVKAIPGQSLLATRYPVNLGSPGNLALPVNQLEKVFMDTIADHHEGLVLKSEESKYHDSHLPWVKIKKDYIPGHGDCIDLVVAGASWEKERARELRVPPTVFTTLYLGVIATNTKVDSRPHVHIYFTASYGLSRFALEEINFLLRTADTRLYDSNHDGLEYTFDLPPYLKPPTIILARPLLCEVFGAGFTKAPFNKLYELRFPRINKIYRSAERNWRDGIGTEELDEIVFQYLGRSTIERDARHWCSALWLNSNFSDRQSSKRRNTEPSDNPLPSFRRRAKKNKSDETEISEATGAEAPENRTSSSIDTRDLDRVNRADHHEPHISRSMTQILDPPTKLTDESETTQVQLVPQWPTQYPLLERDTVSLKFSRSTLVWFAKAHPTTEGLSQHDWMSQIPHSQRIHSLDSLLSACGWSNNIASPAVVRQGVIFVDGSRLEWKSFILDLLKKSQTVLPVKRKRGNIWVFDASTWSFRSDDIERLALLRLG